MARINFCRRISVLFIVPFLLTIFSQGALAQEVNLCLGGTPSHLILNPPYNPGCPNYFGYGTLQINSRINDGSISAPAVGYLTHTPGYRFSTTVDLAEISTVNEIEVVFRGLMNPSGAYIKAFIYDGSWQQVGSVNPYSVWGDAIANLPPKTFEFTSGAPWNNVTRVRAETYGNYIPSPFGGYCVQAYIYELRAFGPACVPNDYSACYVNDRYWYDSCDVRDGLRQDCGVDGVDLWGLNYCNLDDVYRSRDVHDRGCVGDACFDNTSAEEELVQDCGVDSPDSWGANYCQNDDIYRSRTVHDRGCSGDACFDNTSTEEEVVQDCGVGCVCTVAVECNCPPVANADGPYVITLPSTVVNLGGSGSVDAVDCPGGGIGCDCLVAGPPCLTYGWVIVNDLDSAGCELVASGVQSSITCSSEGSAVVTLTVTDSGGLQHVDSTAITVNYAPGGGPEFNIVSFELVPNPVTVVGSVSVDALVEVVDLGGGPENSEVDISVKDLLGNSKPTDAVSLTQSVGSSPTLFTIPFTVDSGWQPGNYAVTATASKVAAAEPDSQRTAYLSVLVEPRQAVPEIMPLLAVFVAFAVLLVIGLKGRPENL